MDFRQYLAEAYDADEKSDVIAKFAKYLEGALGTTFDPDSNKHVRGPLWFTIGNGNGKYHDRRITVGTTNTELENEEDWRTLNFMVSDMGQLVAYLDAEDHGLLYNTPAFKNTAGGGKKLMQWNLGVTDEQLKAAFDGACEYIDEFFENIDVRNSMVTDTIAGYDPLDKFRHMKAMKSRETPDTLYSWTRDDEEQLNDARTELARVNKNIEYYTALLKNVEATGGEDSTVELCNNKIADLTKRKTDLKTDIKDLETDKLNYQKLFNVKGERENAASREMKIQALGLDRGVAAGLSDEQLRDMMKKTFKKNGERRKQRAIKTGDVKDAKAAEKDQKVKAMRDKLKAKLAALKKAK